MSLLDFFLAAVAVYAGWAFAGTGFIVAILLVGGVLFVLTSRMETS